MAQTKTADPATGIPKTIRERICEVLRADGRVQSAVLFGSRAKGTWREGSDIDIAVFGRNLEHTDVWHWKHELDDEVFPWSLDILIVDEHISAPLREHIARVGRPLGC